MNNLGDFFKDALNKSKDAETLKAELVDLLNQHLPGFSDRFGDWLEDIPRNEQERSKIKTVAVDNLRNYSKGMEELYKEVDAATEFIGIGDSTFEDYQRLFADIAREIEDADVGLREISYQLRLIATFLEEETGGTTEVSSNRFPDLYDQGGKRRKKQKNRASDSRDISTDGLSSRLANLGFYITSKSVFRGLDGLSNEEKRRLYNCLTKMENHGGDLRQSPYISNIKQSPYLAIKFSQASSNAYRLIVDQADNNIIDVCDHDTYERKYLSGRG